MELASSTSSSESPRTFNTSFSSEDVEMESVPGPSGIQTPPKITVLNERLAAALDAAKLSDRQAVHILTAYADALGVSLSSTILRRCSIHRSRQKFRIEYMEKIREKSKKFKHKAAVLNWDGKLLPALTGKGKVDRLPILITAEGEEMFLGAPEAQSGTGKDEADAVYETLLQWDFLNEVKAFCCDTTA